MNYKIEEDKVLGPTFTVTEISNDLIDSIADFIEMDIHKVKFFVKKIGLTWIDDPDIIGATDEQVVRILELRSLLRRMN